MPRVVRLTSKIKRQVGLKLDANSKEIPIVVTIYSESKTIGFRRRRAPAKEEFVLPLSQVYALALKSNVLREEQQDLFPKEA